MSAPQQLPPAEREIVIDVSLRHVLAAFGGLSLTLLTVGLSIAMVRDFSRYRRQKALIAAASELLKTLQFPERRTP